MPNWNFWRRKDKLERELDSEIRFHFEKLVEDKIAVGIPPNQARREAAIEFGGREQVKEDLRDVHSLRLMDAASANISSGFRLIRKSPSFSAAVVLTLALGIGANSAVFSALDAVLLRPLPFPHSDELMLLHQTEPKSQNPESFIAPARLEDWNRLNRTFQAISGWYTSDVSDQSGSFPEKVTEAFVAPRFLQVWGVSPILGRDFTPEEEHFGGPNAVLISYRYWQRRFHGDPTVVGMRLQLDQYRYPIIGVLPASFLFPDHDVDIWNTSAPDAPYAQNRQSTWFTGIGRLKPGVTPAEGRADLQRVQAQLGREFPKTDAALSATLEPLKEATVAGIRRSLWLLFGSVSLLLLIACTNIAGMLLARTTERAREISVRFSLGASRFAIIAQLLTESFVLAVIGAALGLIVATTAAKAFSHLAAGVPRADEIALDWRVVCYSLVCAVAATLLFGLFPAFRATRRELAAQLAHSSRTQVSAANPLQWLLTGIQVTLAVTLLVGAGLLLRSFQELGRVSPGMDLTHVLTFRISGNWGETADYKKLRARINETLEALRTLPGVRGAATAGFLPAVNADFQTEVQLIEGRAESLGKITGYSRFVSNGYFETMKVPMIAGTGCKESYDNSTAVVNRSFATKYLGLHRTIGYHLKLVSSAFPLEAQISGIATDARERGLNIAPEPTIYWCENAPTPTPYFLVRTSGEPMAMAHVVRQAIHKLDPGRSVYDISALTDHVSDEFAQNRLRTELLSLFAATAVSLACVGLYGSLSYFVSVRKREIGLRIALGALRPQILSKYLLKGVSVSLTGCVAGLCLGVAFTRVLSGMLYGVSALDPETMIAIPVLILAVAALASLLPAMRAARLDAMQVLREE